MEQGKIIVLDKQIYEVHQEMNEVTYEASIAEKNFAIYLIFSDPEQKIKTTIKIKDNIVYVKRQGSINTNLEFREGFCYNTSYPTGFGNMDISVVTKRIEMTRELSHFQLKLYYELWMQQAKISDNIYSIKRI